jgi:Ni/Co efflux regulator RcnB
LLGARETGWTFAPFLAFSDSSREMRHGPAVTARLNISAACKRLARLVGVAALSAMLVGGPAAAEGHGHGYGREGGHGRWAEEGGGRWRGGGGGWRGEEGPPREGPPRNWGYPAWGPYGSPYPQRPIPPGFAIRRGGMIPPEYRGAIVPDYGRHRLRPPPPGFAWVRMGDRYMLVSRATGQIFDVIGE